MVELARRRSAARPGAPAFSGRDQTPGRRHRHRRHQVLSAAGAAAQSINFDRLAESISFDGFTGPYCQYAYARIHGILEKAVQRGLADADADFARLGNLEELLLLKMLIQFPEEVASAVAEYNPSRVAAHIFNTAKAFNQFYNKHAVIQAENPETAAARLALIKATAAVLKRGLGLLGVDVLENM